MYRKVALGSFIQEMQKMGIPAKAVEIMGDKGRIEPVKIFQVRSPAANIIKQDLLSLGGECATEPSAITCSSQYVDILLLGTRGQYKKLTEKLDLQAEWFGLAKVIQDINSYLEPGQLLTKLADGRTITYEKTKIMGILNVTPDSFYAPSRVKEETNLLTRAEAMLKNGADILDIGGESTRPGSEAVSETEEVKRVVPVIKSLKAHFPSCIISIDTRHSTTAKEALLAGGDIINDISAGEGDPGMLPLAKKSQAPIILMHMRGTPQTMSHEISYDNVVDQVAAYLQERMLACYKAGLGEDKIILDPGIGFAKGVQENLALLGQLTAFTGYGVPVLLGTSRKTTLGAVLGGLPPEERLEATLATSCQGVFAGVNIIRVHDVKANFRAVRMLEAML